MATPPSPRSRRSALAGAALSLLASLRLLFGGGPASADEPARGPAPYPTIPAEHKHARMLLENALRFADTSHKLSCPTSGYPFEGWNQDPSKGLFLRSFTQLTAIGLQMELYACVIAGEADSPGLSREAALAGLSKIVAALRRDQVDPKLGAKGLLVNFLDLATGTRLSPLASDVDKSAVLAAFGRSRGESIWGALTEKGWIAPRNADREAEVKRGEKYGWDYFDGPLAPYKDDATRKRVMDLLDQRVVLVVFGDNANLSASAAKTIGALLSPGVAGRPEVVALREQLDRFLDAQAEGYAHLHDAKVGLFNFGWDVTRDRLFGWEDPTGKWTTGHMDYFVNEFRGPATFVAARFGLPNGLIGNLGFKVKPYRLRDGSEVYALAPWEGSAFQALGLGLMLDEMRRPGWRVLLPNVVAIEIDASSRRGLPGFLSESYTGEGTKYTGAVGIPEIAVSPKPRVTDAASLYSLGVAYSVRPAEVESFLGSNWPILSTLLTDHGPWEGYNVTTKDAIRLQTTAHTLSLALGLLGTGSVHMARYAERAGFAGRLAEFFPVPKGGTVDLLDPDSSAFSWGNKEGRLVSAREGKALHVRGDGLTRFGVALVSKTPDGINLSASQLVVRYRSVGAIDPVVIALKPEGVDPSSGLIPIEIFTRLVDTDGRDGEIRIPLPATVGLSRIKEVVLTHERPGAGPVDLSILGVTVER